MNPIFITGTGTGIGKTVVSAIVARALGADYWKPVQAGIETETDSEIAGRLLSRTSSKIHQETYQLKLPASPHLAARHEGITINLEKIKDQQPKGEGYLVVEGAGGLMVPLNNNEFVSDLILKLNARVILVSRNYLGSINHSLLTAAACRQQGLKVAGWIFNDEYMNYQDEIATWSGYPVIGAIPAMKEISSNTVHAQSLLIREKLLTLLEKGNR